MSYSEIKTEFAAYQNNVNLDLFGAVLYLAAVTSEDEEAVKKYRLSKKSVIWGNCETVDATLLEERGLRYIGEVLERYEEHFGSGKENMRAIALALGYAAPFLTSGMFIGSQKDDFLKRVQRESAEDVYLQAALYLLESSEEKHNGMLAKLSQTIYQKTEEAMFVLSLYEDLKQGFEAMRPQLVRLWGKERSISLVDNIGILEWLVVKCEPIIKACRKKDNAILRTLMKLPYMFVKKDSPAFLTLTSAGYSNEEITYANSAVLWDSRIRERLNYDGIPAEKIAAECCITWLNSEQEPNQGVLEYIGWLLTKYKNFSIKYHENEGVWPAIRDFLKPVQPKVVVWMVQNLKKEVGKRFPYCFNVLNNKWDVLAYELEIEQYRTIFSGQLLSLKGETPEQIKRWLEKFKELTGQEYVDTFSSHENYYISECFAFLAEHQIIDLEEFFQRAMVSKQKNAEHTPEIYYLKNYISEVKTREAFDFLNQFLREHSIAELNDIFSGYSSFHNGFCDCLYNGYRSSETKVDFLREFLSMEEERQLFHWIDESVFRMEPDKYLLFITATLRNKDIQKVFKTEELRSILKTLIELNQISEYESRPLKERFFTEEELKREKEAAAIAAAEKEKQEEIIRLEKKKQALEEIFDGSFDSLLRYSKNYFWKEDKKTALELTYEKLNAAVEKTEKPVDIDSMSSFLELCSVIMENNAILWEKLYPLIYTMIEGGVQ